MNSFVHYPEGHVLLRNLNKKYPIVSHGKGVHLFDETGKKYFDASGGALVATLGHGNEALVARVAEQMTKVAYVNGMQFTSRPMEQLANHLARRAAPLGLDRVTLLASGSEAIEAAVKFARQLWVDRGFPAKHKLITRTPGYHGNTLYALSASGRPHYKKVYGPLLSPVLTVSTPYAYRCPVVQSNDPDEMLREYHEKGAEHYLRELEALIEREDPATISALMLETISGSSTGGWIPPKGYLHRVEALCRKHDILIIADEVLCGSGRTGKFFAAEHEHFKPDVLVLGKGLNAGLMPVAALLTRTRDVNTMKSASGGFLHAQTYMQAPSMAATALAVVEYLDEHQVLAKAEAVSRHWQQELQRHLHALPFVGSVTGIGHMAGVEFVEDKASKKPFPIAKKFAQKFVQHAQDQGLILWPNYGQADGTNGDLVILGPSLEMTMTEADECVDRLKRALLDFPL